MSSKTRDVVNHLQLLGCAHQTPRRGLIDKGNDPPQRAPKVAARGAWGPVCQRLPGGVQRDPYESRVSCMHDGDDAEPTHDKLNVSTRWRWWRWHKGDAVDLTPTPGSPTGCAACVAAKAVHFPHEEGRSRADTLTSPGQ